MKNYSLINATTGQIVKDEEGNNVEFTASKKESIVMWLDQKCFEMNGFGKTSQYRIETKEV